MNIKKYIGNKAFYSMVLAVAVPIMVQNGITNFVSMLDNIMVGRVGTDAMSGVAIANQFMFIFNLFIFGAISGAGIFTAQFYGSGDDEGVRQTFRYKLMLSAAITVIGLLILGIYRTQLISLFLHEGSSSGSIDATLKSGTSYLLFSLLGIIPFVITQCYSGTLRETGETIIPMKAGIVAVFVNLVFNYILIFGHFGAPVLGIVGAAIATVLSRFVECFIVVYWTHSHTERNGFIVGTYSSLHVDKALVRHITIKGTPLLLNEGLWAMGISFLNQIYSRGGLAVVAGLNISNTLYNVFNIVFIAFGNAIAIIVGQLLGAGKMREAKETDTKLIAFSVTCCAALGFVLCCISPYFPYLYNTTPEVRHLASRFILAISLFMPFEAFMNASYFTLRSGGKTFVTFLFDSVFVWSVLVPTAYILITFTSLNIVVLYAIVQFMNIIKCTVGFILVKKNVWINNLIIH